MDTATTKSRYVAIVRHAAWLDAHKRGQTRKGRFLFRDHREPNRKRQASRRACRGKVSHGG